MNPEELGAFITEHWHGDEQSWLQALVDHQVLAFDWPAPLGSNWSRARQLAFIQQLVDAGCPLFPEAMTVIAPVILNLAEEPEKTGWLRDLREHPSEWLFNQASAFSLQVVDDTLYLFSGTSEYAIGTRGAAAGHLASSFSAAHLIHEYLLSLEHIRCVTAHWSEETEPTTTEISDWNTAGSGLEALFLRNTPLHDRQLAVRIESSRMERFSTLFSLLGYYALLEPDPLLSDNEPLPFNAERNHLAALRRMQDRDDRLQRDAIFEEYLAGEADQ